MSRIAGHLVRNVVIVMQGIFFKLVEDMKIGGHCCGSVEILIALRQIQISNATLPGSREKVRERTE